MASQPPLYLYCDGFAGLVSYTYRSSLSVPKMVSPQAPNSLWPMETPGKRRLAAADHIPPRRDQMHPVAQRGRLLHAMRIVRQQRIAAVR